MEIVKYVDEYFEGIADMAYEKYCGEVQNHSWLVKRTRSEFMDYLREKLQGMNGFVGLENGNCIGFLLYSLWEGEKQHCDIPVWGYGAGGKKDAQTISRLFQHLAQRIVVEKPVCFSARLYAHDTEMQRLFSLMQFGIQSEKDIRCIGENDHAAQYEIREIGKEELQQRWDELWGLLTQLINHLQESPVFYPGTEFTEEVYKDFLADLETKVYIAEDRDRMIGLIQANSENMGHLFPGARAVNVGEAYVEPQYRGQKVAQALLYYLEADLKADGVKYEWVEHGTANPTARGFWNKYFETVEYEFIRETEAVHREKAAPELQV